MATTLVSSYLSKNLAALNNRDGDLRDRLLAAHSRPDFQIEMTAQKVPSGSLNGKLLCSRHRPLEEAARQVDSIDLVEHAVIVVFGFGMGYHVQRLAERGGKATLIIVFEPDLSLLRSVFEHVDHSAWMKNALLLFVTDSQDRGALAQRLQGSESILAQGVEFFEHPACRVRLHRQVPQFTTLFKDFVSAAKTTLLTTLMRSVDTARNLISNLDHYACGPGIIDLQNAACQKPAIVVSAGPSLHKNVHLLEDPKIRERCVIVAVQTTLKPLLDRGIRPHFVTALDYHEISKRFYEGLTADDLRGVTLIADPKAHPVILDAFHGEVRCCANGFLDKLLGPLRRDMGNLPAGATVAHLAMYVARHLGCNPIGMIGQDLGFTDGLYYAPRIAIHDTWAPELNQFNTLEMMEWQRIVRHRLHLHRVKDVNGKSIYTDGQMHTYLQQFERDFAQYATQGIKVIDATEGGVAKQHTVRMPLKQFCSTYVMAGAPLQLPSSEPVTHNSGRLEQVRKRVHELRSEVAKIKDLSLDTASVLQKMIRDQHDLPRMSKYFERIQQNRSKVEKHLPSLDLLNQLNQLGTFNRLKADRRLHMQQGLTPLQKQRGQLERDLQNVTWIADAAAEMITQLESAPLIKHPSSLAPRENNDVRVNSSQSLALRSGLMPESERQRSESRISALIAIDPVRNGLGLSRSLATPFGTRTTLQATLERLGRSEGLHSIVLISPSGFELDRLIDRKRISLPIELDYVEGSPFGPEHEAIAAARLWSDTSWRGGIAGISIYDEVLCPQAMCQSMQRRNLTAALIVGPDWPLVQVNGEFGCDAIIRRHLEHPLQHNLVFSQSPPGLCGCLISAKLMEELSQRNRLSNIGGLLVYQPHAPQGDPIARDANVQVPHELRTSLGRFTFDSPRQITRMQSVAPSSGANEIDVVALDTQLHPKSWATPQQIVLELTTRRCSSGRFRKHPKGAIQRPDLSLALAKRVFDQVASLPYRDIALTLDGAGDPLLHDDFDQIIKYARAAGIAGINVRTELLADRATIDKLLACDIDVLSVDLNADRAATYESVMGIDRFKDVVMNIEYVLSRRRRLTDHTGNAAYALPWVVPHLERRSETYEDIDTFFDRWQRMLGTAVIEGPPPFDEFDDLAPAVTPQQVVRRDEYRRMTIFADGSVPLSRWDWTCSHLAGNISSESLMDLWNRRCELLLDSYPAGADDGRTG